ncbi:hemagglutinin repeat-containing protein [Caballeronia sp. Lep1P3]|uniref:hemagglutinin repeat-containing protein n=1 Tax=Caballeronia sp. Lep1P3 TaxID=2878150 RepID=UPI00351CDB72
MLLLGTTSTLSAAQIVAAPGSGAQVIQTQNGLAQVNIARPSAAGVSVGTFSQFDVPAKGAILNNSPTLVQTQQAGYINGNPNLSPGQSARIIVNQVMSNSPSQLHGYTEVAGARAEVVIANPSGIVVDGAGFINTSRAILTTGTPNFGANGSLAGFNVTGGNITVQGAGLNASNVDQVDLLARAVQVNAAIYANNLNVIAGASSIDHDSLNATSIAGNGAAPSVAIDVSALGGMYANRIFLSSNEYGVGVSTNGVLAAQAGDLTLKSNGQLVLAGQTNASGSINASARDGIANTGTTYAQGNVIATTSGALTNTGILAAQHDTTINAGSVASTGTLGAGVNQDGTIANSGELNVLATGAVVATGRNEGGGNTTIRGASVNLAGSNTSANSALTLAANSGDMNLANATTTAGGALNVTAAGTLTNDGGKLSSGGSMQVSAGNVSNANGQLVSQSTLDLHTAGNVNNRGGTMQAAARESIRAASLDNTAGRIVSLNADGMSLTATGAFVNGAGGLIGTNGALGVSAGALSNQGQLTAAGDATVNAQSIDNHAGSMTAGGALGVTIPGALNNAGGTLSGATATVSAASIDNTNGDIEGDALAVSTPGNLVNRGGKITQFGASNQTISAGGVLDNTGGTISSNASNLSVGAQSVTNDSGTIQHAGTGTLTVNSRGALSNAAGQIVTNGALALQAVLALNNAQGVMQAARRADVRGASLNNTGGRIVSLNADGLTRTYSEQSLSNGKSQHAKSSYDEQANASNVSAGGDVVLAAGQNGGGNLAVLGSNVTADKGGVALISTGDVTVGSVSETHDAQGWSHSDSSGFLSKTTTSDVNSSHQVIANGSTISGDTVTGKAGRDMTISGSTVAATHDVSLDAARDLTITTTQDTSRSSSFHQETKTGLGASGGAGISYGTNDQKDTTHDASVTNNGSLIGSTDGSVHLSAGNDLHVTGSELIAAKDLIGKGANVTIDAATDTAHHDEKHEVSQSGFTLAIKAPVIDAISNTVDQAHAAGESKDDRAAALHGIAAASGAVDAFGAAGGAAGSLANGQAPSAKVELSYGSSHSESTFAQDSTTSRGSNVVAGGTASFKATGNAEVGSGNVTIAGSNVNANDVILNARNQVNLVSSADTDSNRSTNESSSGSIGVSYGIGQGSGGFGVSASMSMANGNSNSDTVVHHNTHINAGNSTTIVSGGDTNIVGANVDARQVKVDVGGNLNIASEQDTSHSAAHQSSAGGGFSISQGGGSASVSVQNGNAHGDYAGVAEQSGIHAGDGGFDINVAKNTDLKGAVIASDADASKNTLNTGTLTFSDIHNHSDYTATSTGISAGGTTGDGGNNYATTGQTSGKDTGGALPTFAHDSGSSNATTRSAVSAGTINVTDNDHQTQDIASLSRDTMNTNGHVTKLPDVSAILNNQADLMNAVTAAAAAVARRVGDYADSKFKETGDPRWLKAEPIGRRCKRQAGRSWAAWVQADWAGQREVRRVRSSRRNRLTS